MCAVILLLVTAVSLTRLRQSPSGALLACGALDGAVSVFDIASGTQRRVVAATAAFSHVAGTGRALFKIDAHAKAVRSLAFSADGARLLTASDDMHIGVHDWCVSRRHR
jgi:WD40 repeat protein